MDLSLRAWARSAARTHLQIVRVAFQGRSIAHSMARVSPSCDYVKYSLHFSCKPTCSCSGAAASTGETNDSVMTLWYWRAPGTPVLSRYTYKWVTAYLVRKREHCHQLAPCKPIRSEGLSSLN